MFPTPLAGRVTASGAWAPAVVRLMVGPNVVLRPFGVTVPATPADVPVTPDAAPVVTAGAATDWAQSAKPCWTSCALAGRFCPPNWLTDVHVVGFGVPSRASTSEPSG